jgi:phytoene desaturase
MSSSPRCEHRKIAIIGSGLAGLSSAVQLAHAGGKVTVFEKLDQPGGRLVGYEQDGFAWDTVSGSLTRPGVLRQLFARLGRKLEDYLKLVPLPVACRYFWPDGTRIDHDEKFRQRPEVAKYLEFAKGALAIADSFNGLVEHEWWKSVPSLLAQARHWPKLIPGLTLHRLSQWFYKDPHLIQLFDRLATRTGSSPFAAPAFLSLFAAAEAEEGAWAVEGGTRQIVQALLRVAREEGVEILTGTEITGIYGSNVAIAGKWQSFDATICTQDALMAYQALLPRKRTGEFRDAYLTRYRASFSSYSLLLGVKGQYPQLACSNLLFSSNHAREFLQLVKERAIPEEPTIELTVCSKSAPESAPEGCESWLVRVSAPAYRSSIKWEEQGRPFGDRIISRLEASFGLADLGKHIVTRHDVTPTDLLTRFQIFGGAEHGFASHNLRNALLGPQVSPPGMLGFFFAGNSMRPTGGITQVLQNADRAVLSAMGHLRGLPPIEARDL